jgi:riboflavin synthase
MFSGIIEDIYKISHISPFRIGVLSKKSSDSNGDSMAINGVCLTVVQSRKSGAHHELWFDLSQETLDKTTLGGFKTGLAVNIERALKVSDALGGHIVQGHVDGVGKVVKIEKRKENWVMWFTAPREIKPFLVPKGSIAIDGVSLTVVKIIKNAFSVALIPFTLTHTNLGKMRVGDKVNLEADVIAKYIRKYTKRT